MAMNIPRDGWLDSARAQFETATALILSDAVAWPDNMFATQDQSDYETEERRPAQHAQDVQVEAEREAESVVGTQSTVLPMSTTPPVSILHPLHTLDPENKLSLCLLLLQKL